MEAIAAFLDAKWAAECVPTLEAYARIPCQSPTLGPTGPIWALV